MTSPDVKRAPKGTYNYLQNVYEETKWGDKTHYDIGIIGGCIVQINRERMGHPLVYGPGMELWISRRLGIGAGVIFRAQVNPDDSLAYLSTSVTSCVKQDIRVPQANIVKMVRTVKRLCSSLGIAV